MEGRVPKSTEIRGNFLGLKFHCCYALRLQCGQVIFSALSPFFVLCDCWWYLFPTDLVHWPGILETPSRMLVIITNSNSLQVRKPRMAAEPLWMNSEQQINVQKIFRASAKWFLSGKLYMSVGQCRFFYRRTVDYNWTQDIHILQWILYILLEGNCWGILDLDSTGNEWANLEFIGYSQIFLFLLKRGIL